MITFNVRNRLYINITNSTTNHTDYHSYELGSENSDVRIEDLRFESEPTLDEIMADVLGNRLSMFSEIVFSGNGEPTCRLYDMIAVCRKIREVSPSTPIRINTNGHASMILGEDTTPLFKGLADKVSVSIFAPDSIMYERICRPRFGENAFPAVLKFVRDIQRYVSDVTLTIPENTLSDEDTTRCAGIARDLGCNFLVRDPIM